MRFQSGKFIFVAVLFFLLCIATTVFLSAYLQKNISGKQIAFVRSAYVIENFHGVKAVLKKYNAELLRQQQEIDSLQLRYAALQKRLQDKKSLSGKHLKETEQSLHQTLQRLSELTNEINPQAQASREALMQGALNQINFYVEKYARENRIDLVLGVTLDGNVLYGEDYLDITDEILTGLNNEYN